MNYWVYFNSSPVPEPADLVILDDAHLAEQPLTGLDVLRIDKRSEDTLELYRSLCDIVTAHNDLYVSVKSMRDGHADPTISPELIAFNHWASIHSSFRECIESSSAIAEGDGQYTWRRIRDHLLECCVVVSAAAVEIRPYLPLTTLNKSYYAATQRLYLSATLGSMDDLQRRIGSNRIQRLDYATDVSRVATGDRRLILNPTMNRTFDGITREWLFDQVDHANGIAAWLCSSIAEADEIEGVLKEEGEDVYRLIAGNDSAISDWISASKGHLISAGRYDGLDLAGDICHLVVVPSIPQSTGDLERFVASHVADATYIYHRTGQRMTQALGRANRSPDDYALYIGMDPRFGELLAHPDVQESLPRDLKTEVDSALALHEQGMNATSRACEEFWSEEAEHEDDEGDIPTDSVERRPGRRRRQEPGTQTATDEVSAVTELWIGGHREAAAAAARVADTLASSGSIGILCLLALYRSTRTLLSA